MLICGTVFELVGSACSYTTALSVRVSVGTLTLEDEKYPATVTGVPMNLVVSDCLLSGGVAGQFVPYCLDLSIICSGTLRDDLGRS